MPKFSILAVLLLAACSADTRDLERKVDALSTRINVLEARVGSGAPRAQRPRRPEPDPKDVYAVSIDGLPSKGPADAPVTIVEGYEYACPACAKVRATVAEVRARYGDRVRVIPKQYIVHPDTATAPAQAICAATRQGKFEAMDALLWDKAYAAGRDFSASKLEALAVEAKLDLAAFKADMAGPCKEHVARSHTELQTVGLGMAPEKSPSEMECLYCNIPRLECPEKAIDRPKVVEVTDF
jgi:protein-disulfide isomerase